MRHSITVLEPKFNQPDRYQLCIGEYEDDARLSHGDYVLTVDDLWELKRQLDRELLERAHHVHGTPLSMTFTALDKLQSSRW